MGARKKLEITFKIIILFALTIFSYLILKNNLLGGSIYIIIITIFVVLAGIIFNKKAEYSNLSNQDIIPIGYTIGAIILSPAIISSFWTIKNIIENNSVSWGLLLGSLVVGIFGIFLIYYSHKTKKESSIMELKEKTRKTINKKQKKFLIIYLIGFIIIIGILRYLFKLIEFTLINITIHIITIVFIYFLLRIILSKKRKNKKNNLST